MNFSKGPLRTIYFLQVIILVFALLPASISAAETVVCLECHKKFAEEEFKNSFIHKPFLEKKCLFCHAPNWVNDAAESDGKAIFPHKTKLLAHDENPSQSHIFAIPREVEPSMLFIEAMKPKTGEPFRVKIKVPIFATLETLTDDSTPPEIKNVKVIEVKRSTMSSATIKFNTDKHTHVTLRYGLNEPEGETLTCNMFDDAHLLQLQALKPDATYYFRIEANDIYGNSAESPVYSFTTDKDVKVMESSLETVDSALPIKLKSEILRSEDNYMVRISANQPVAIEITTYEISDFLLERKTSKNFPQKHPPLKSLYETNVVTCESCHEALSKKFPHPVHFRARLGSNIPDEYPRLPNNQMSCLTCHKPHASNNKNHLRKSADRELCIGCHKRSFRN